MADSVAKAGAGRVLRGRPFADGEDPRRGRGPRKGKGGRTPDQLRTLATEALPAFIDRCREMVERGEDELAIKAGLALFKVSGLDRLEVNGAAMAVFPAMRVIQEAYDPILSAPLPERIARIKQMLAESEQEQASASTAGEIRGIRQ